MTYGWTIQNINEITLPEILALLNQIKEMPPADIILQSILKSQAPKPLDQQIGKMGVPVRKGKVKRRK